MAGSTRFPHNGMENWGLVIYHDSVLAQEPGYTDGWSDKQYALTILAHETSHMWFGNSVTFKWWNYFWLNEAFARYYEYFMAHELYPEYELDKQFTVKQVQLIFGTDATNNTQPLTSLEETINTPSEIGYKFSGITYAKGAAVLRMFANIMGKTNFDQAVREYLKENHLKNVVPEDLFKYLKKHWPKDHQVDLDELFKDWTEQVGYPVVTVTASPSGRFTLKQKRFLLDPNDGSDASLRYTIPITFNNDMKTNYTEFTPKFYFNKTLEEVAFGNTAHHDWVIVNTQQSNYYRVFYEAKLQRHLRIAFEQENHSGIHVSNRASVIDDLFTFGLVGLKGYDEIFEFMEYLATETEYTPWYAAFKGFNNVYVRLTLEQHKEFGKFLIEVLDKVYKKLGFENPNDTILDVYNRNKVISWLCRYHHEDCNAQAVLKLNEYLTANTKPSPDFREALYCAANRNDALNIYDSLLRMFNEEELMSEKEKILRAMGCTRYLVKSHYEFILSDNVPQELKTTGLSSLYNQTPENIKTVFQLMTDNVEELEEALQSWSTTADVISGISNYLTTQEELNMLLHFTNEKGHLFGSSIRTLENAITSTENNLKWAGSHLGKLFSYLDGRNSATTTTAALFLIPLSLITLLMFM
ncbi:aminopeptidase N [Lucilia sericata]|uniref:aminopeptidase N n=1 Tax=Lucilia sericata TaxID=13632 RepID=UPI0018A879E4|nr:aminopeptidase N [Lucilia sericata]